MPNVITLTAIQGKLQGKKYIFDSRTTCIIGRSEDCQIMLPNDEEHRGISRYHCLLDINPPSICIRDFGSLNGTLVNGQNIGQRLPGQTPAEGAKLDLPTCDLQTGNQIQLSNTIFQVEIEVEEAPVFSQPAPENLSEIVAQLIDSAMNGERDLSTIKGYRILKTIGTGGFGEVFLAEHLESHQLVALKVMLPKVAANERAVQMFLREINITKSLDHPNLVQLIDYGHADGTFFMTMEYCEGGSAIDLMKQYGGKLPVDLAVDLILQVLDGLECAHQADISTQLDEETVSARGLVHRDLKPENILLKTEAGRLVAKVADFGLAKAFDLAGLSGMTMSGSAMGTPLFMCRQQILDFKYSKPEIDIWAAAASLYFLLTGEIIREFTRGQDPFVAILQNPPVPIRQRDPQIPQALAEAIDLALIDNPELHFKTVNRFREALQAAMKQK